jgi:plastocyanin
MRKSFAVALIAVAVGAAILVPAATSAPTAHQSATRTIKVGDIYYVSSSRTNPTVSVSRGTKVVWRFVGVQPHTVTVSSGPVKFSSAKKKSGSYSRTVTRAGTYRIYCKIHGNAQRMTLKVK